MMLVDVDESRAQEISTAYLATEDAAQADNRNSWQAFCEFVRLSFGAGGSLARLKELAAAHPHSTSTLGYLARGYEVYQDYGMSARTYEAAAKEANEAGQRLRLLRNAAAAYVHAEAPEAALAVIAEIKAHFEPDHLGELELLNALKAYIEIDKDDDLIVALMERISDIDPSDTDARFSLAYKHSELGNNELALFHYKRIPSGDRKAITWNNLGVALANAGLASSAISAYRTAEQMGETLAMSNIAEKFIAAGFLPEAQNECEAALKQPNYSKNVPATLARSKLAPDEENKKASDIMEKVKPISDFYIKAGQAMCRPEPWEISDKWKGPVCALVITTRGTEFLATGSYETRNALGLASAFGLRGEPAREHYQVEYRGKALPGGVIKARVTRNRKGGTSSAANSLLGSSDNESTVIMIITDDKDKIQVMETAKGAAARFYTLTREEHAEYDPQLARLDANSAKISL
jgi:tetratricopeptide (TPR) repeat protein